MSYVAPGFGFGCSTLLAGEQESDSSIFVPRPSSAAVGPLEPLSLALNDALLARAEPPFVCTQAGENALSVAANTSVTRVLEQADCFQRWHRRANLALWRRASGWR